MKSVYDYYQRGSHRNCALAGEVLYLNESPRTTYIVVSWDGQTGLHNYNRWDGLLFVSTICKVDGKSYFNVGVKSPDDWDYGFTVYNTTLRESMIEWLAAYCKKRQAANYKDLFREFGQAYHLNPSDMF
jgi:hypothetical protein